MKVSFKTNNHHGGSHHFLVSIYICAYNHEKYIRRCLDSIISQETDFPYEIIVKDDCSTDGTQGILKEYQSRYPDLIHLILLEENYFSKGKASIAFQKVLEVKQGKYFAICEGDDYWTDNKKLQKQIDILEKNSDCFGCCSNQIVVQENEDPWPCQYQLQFHETQDVKHDKSYLDHYCKFSHTASVVLRSSLFDDMTKEAKEEYSKLAVNGDIKQSALIAAHGCMYHIAQNLACYRFVPKGNSSWSSLTNGKNISWKTLNQLIEIKHFIKKHYNTEILYYHYCEKLLENSLSYLIRQPNKENYKIFNKCLKYTSSM
jgi:glycosyltransferase involved in cell wall biosynthesis